jgi:hypothetical protein
LAHGKTNAGIAATCNNKNPALKAFLQGVNTTLSGVAEAPGYVWPGTLADDTSCVEFANGFIDSCRFDPAPLVAIDDLVKVRKEWTVSFWMKKVPSDPISTNPEILFWASVEDLAPLFAINFRKWADPTTNHWIYCNGSWSAVDDPNGHYVPADNGDWTFVYVGQFVDERGNGGLHVGYNLSAYDESPVAAYCGHNGPLFDAFSTSRDSLMSSITIEPRRVPMAELQRRYYSQMDRYSPRTGPITTTGQRVTRKVAYDRNAFTYPAISLAPAVVIQERFGKTTECQRQAGTQAVQRIHENAVRGSQCALPYECDADL